MPNGFFVCAGTIIILFSTWIFGGIIGILIGFLVLLFGCLTDLREIKRSPNYSFVTFGGVCILISMFLHGGSIGVTFGTFVMILGGYIQSFY